MTFPMLRSESILNGEEEMKFLLELLFWLILVFSVFVQVSDEFIKWLNPTTVSTEDERFIFTFGLVFVNLILLYIMKLMNIRRVLLYFLLSINILFFLYYFYAQYIGDIRQWYW